MMYTMQAPRTICTYDPYNGLVRPFPLLEDMLRDPGSKLGFKISGIKADTSEADLKLLAFLERLLANPPSSDHAGAERVLAAARDHVIGVASQADHADLPLIMGYCKVHQDVMPLTCLMLISYGHTKEWTHVALSQHIFPEMQAMIKKLEPTPMVARAVVAFTAAEYDLTEWMGSLVFRALPRLGFANEVLRRAEQLSPDPIEDARNQLVGLVNDFIKKSGSIANGLLELMTSALNKLPVPDGTALNQKDIDRAGLVMNLLSDNVNVVWPFQDMIGPADLFGMFNEFFDLNQKSRELKVCGPWAFDDRSACTWMLRTLAGEASNLGERLSFISKIDEAMTATLLSGFIEKVDVHVTDVDLKRDALQNLTAGLSNWIATRNLFQTNIDANRQNEILRLVFEPEYLSSVYQMVSPQGRKVVTDFVMTEHRHLARQLHLSDRGRYLEDEIGL